MGLKFEKTVPEWLVSGTEPPDTLKQQGFLPGYKPPAEYFNWFWFGVSAALQEIQEALSAVVFGTPIVTAESTDGVTYTATVDGITELTTGLTITIVPNIVSASISAKLNLNGLGDKYIRQSTTNNSATGLTPKNAGWMAANKPITIQYDGTQWKTVAARSNASDMNGILAIANGGTGGEKFIKDASISGKVITLTYSDGTTKTLTTQDTNTTKRFYGPTALTSGNFTATCDGFLIAVDTSSANGRTIQIFNNSVLMTSHYDHHSSQAFGIAPFKTGDVMSVNAPSSVKYYKMELR